jgi:hypothetical protein
MMSCTDQNTCPGNCLAGDTTPPDPTTGIDCKGCYYDQALACADPQCRVPTAEYLCCITSKCASGDQTCIDQQCSVENETFGLCLYYAASSCLDATNAFTSQCFGAAAATALDAGAD